MYIKSPAFPQVSFLYQALHQQEMVVCWSLAVPLLCSGLDTKFSLFLVLLSGADHGEEGKNEQYDSVYSMPSLSDKLCSPRGFCQLRPEQWYL